jgi:XRE family transcriptional regulator, fatty acid utilization regulator
LRTLRIRSRSPKLFAGGRLRRLREQNRMSQVAVAREAGVSPSYLNQIERDQRPLPDALLRTLCTLFGVEISYFGNREDLRQAQDLREALADPLFGDVAVPLDEIQSAVQGAPEIAQRFLKLYRAYLAQRELELVSRGGREQPASESLAPYDEVRDWIQSRRNHIEALDAQAEAMFETAGFGSETIREDLARRLYDLHRITVASDPSLLEKGMVWRLRRDTGQLLLAEGALPSSRLFWMAHIIGQFEAGRLIDHEVRQARLSTPEARSLARVGLANYYAGALVMPYRRFLDASNELRHDIERLQSRFGTSFEQVCHRLSTMQRPGLPGIPFFFVKTDIAGNVLKRSSATPMQFARFGGPCPLWNVYRAFASPGQILVQLARTPDNITYLNVARTVGRTGGFHLARPRSVAVVLGCEMAHAHRTVYATGLDLGSPETAVPIGPGCRMCERTGCRHRAVPPVGQKLDVGTGERGVIPYRIRA